MLKAIGQMELASQFVNGRIPSFMAIYFIDEPHSSAYPRLMHTHVTHLELYFVKGGTGSFVIGDRLYPITEGDLLIFNAGMAHGENPEDDRASSSYCCAFKDLWIPSLPPNHLITSNTNPVIHCGSYAPYMRGILDMLYDLAAKDGTKSICFGLAMSVLLFALHMSEKASPRVVSNAELVASQVKEYLDTNYTKTVDLELIGKALGMSPYYISHVFKNVIGYSPIKYLTLRRIGEAQSLLQNSEMTAADISEYLGYCNPCQFNTMFKKYVGLTPLQYRQCFVIKEQTYLAE